LEEINEKILSVKPPRLCSGGFLFCFCVLKPQVEGNALTFTPAIIASAHHFPKLWEINLVNNPLEASSYNVIKAGESRGAVIKYGNVITVKVNEYVQSYYGDEQPVLENGTVLVPMRRIFVALGADITWDGETQSITSNESNCYYRELNVVRHHPNKVVSFE
jgi:hypothetical protein